MPITLSRRHFLASSAAALAVGTSGVLPAWAQNANLRLIFWGGQARADRTYGVVDLFTAEHPDVSIEGEFLGWADYWPKVATQTAGGNQPDIIQMDYRYIGEYARRGSLAPLDSYVGAGLDISSFDEDQLRNGTIDGKLIGVSLGVAAGATVFNSKVLSDAGVEILEGVAAGDRVVTYGAYGLSDSAKVEPLNSAAAPKAVPDSAKKEKP